MIQIFAWLALTAFFPPMCSVISIWFMQGSIVIIPASKLLKEFNLPKEAEEAEEEV